jgi:hypothetical protein
MAFERDAAALSWVPLERYAAGTLTAPRNFTWWTTLDISDGDVVRNVRRVGMPDEWLPELAVVLRCAAGAKGTPYVARVPTAVDGFVSEVFHPRKLTPAPDCGVAIHLTETGALARGEREVVVPAIPVSVLSLKTVLINRADLAAQPVALGGGLPARLVDYYRGL